MDIFILEFGYVFSTFVVIFSAKEFCQNLKGKKPKTKNSLTSKKIYKAIEKFIKLKLILIADYAFSDYF